METATEQATRERWEQYQAERKAQSQRLATEMKQLSKEIAAALGEGWQFREPEEDDNYWYVIAYLPKCTSIESGIEAKCSIDIQRDTQGRKQIYHVGCGSVRTKTSGSYETFGQFSINVSREKSAQQIARDIKRRLLPGYLPAFDAAVEKAKARNQAADDTWATTRELAAIIGYTFCERELEERRAELNCYKHGYQSVRINSADSIDMKISCNRETAKRILEVIGTKKN